MFGKIKALDPTIRLTLPTLITSPDTCRAVVLCEGKTDGIHLQAALQYFIERGEFVDLDVYFYKYLEAMLSFPFRLDRQSLLCRLLLILK